MPHIRRRLKKFGVLPGDDVTTVNFEKTSRYNLYRLNGKLVNLGFLAEKNHVSVNFLRMKFKALDVVPGDDISGLELSDKYAGKIVYRFKYHGRDINLQEIAQKFDIKVTLARKKIHRMGITNGADITHIDFSPERKRNKFILNGNVVTVKDLAALLDVTTAVIYAKIKKHNILPGDDVTEFFNSKTF
ncbi:hypothetical protein [Mixta intestinalis]|uniref:Uncharacterized protein n=1 Tax=Mixta intestinalis TaxID=1615494 RepID=A0A6P1Q7M1_9GAMM|nr:hypothetical protein [Mixta intestinalis]QHM74079.1 hypothetical protein C7M51_04440 [Mixta intestinalis]